MPGGQVITLDPLSEYADPKLYVSLASGERALAEIEARLRAGRSPVLLSGPAGVGKSMLLSVLAERERGSRVSVRVARTLAHPPEEVGRWLLRLLFGKFASSAGEAELVLLEKLRAVSDKPILLLVDDIHLAPIGSVRKLAALARGGAPALDVVVCGRDGPDLEALTPSLAPECTLALPQSLPEVEIEALYDAILAHPGLSPRVLHRLEGVARTDILRAARGRPGLLRTELGRREPRKPRRDPTPAAPVQRRDTPPRVAVAEFLEAEVAEKAGRRAPERIRSVVRRVVQPVVSAHRAARVLLASLSRALAYTARLPRSIGSSALGGVATLRDSSTALLRFATDSVARSGAWLAGSIVAAGRETTCAASRFIRDGRAKLTGARVELGFAARDVARTARRAGLAPFRWSAGALRRVRDVALAAAREHSSRVSRELGAVARKAAALTRGELERALARTRRTGGELLERSQARATRASSLLRTLVREATRGFAAAAARTRRAALRATPAAALPATALLAVAVFSLSDFEPDLETPLRALASVADVAYQLPSASPVSVQVNARPWARVRIDGVDLGATPLSHRLAPGIYELEAEFPDGKRVERKIVVRPESRFVSLP